MTCERFESVDFFCFSLRQTSARCDVTVDRDRFRSRSCFGCSCWDTFDHPLKGLSEYIVVVKLRGEPLATPHRLHEIDQHLRAGDFRSCDLHHRRSRHGPLTQLVSRRRQLLLFCSLSLRLADKEIRKCDFKSPLQSCADPSDRSLQWTPRMPRASTGAPQLGHHHVEARP